MLQSAEDGQILLAEEAAADESKLEKPKVKKPGKFLQKFKMIFKRIDGNLAKLKANSAKIEKVT